MQEAQRQESQEQFEVGSQKVRFIFQKNMIESKYHTLRKDFSKCLVKKQKTQKPRVWEIFNLKNQEE